MPEARPETVSLAEEELRVSTREVATGKVRIRTVVDTVDEIARAALDTSAVEVVRVPVDRIVDAAPEVRNEGGVLIVPVLEEILVVEKRLLLKEELHVRRTTTTETVEVPVTLRKQRAVVDRIPPSSTDEEA